MKLSVLPQIQIETTELTEKFQEKSEELDECRELLGKRRNLLEKVKKHHWDLSQALQLNLITKSHFEEKIEDNEKTLTQVEMTFSPDFTFFCNLASLFFHACTFGAMCH